MTFYRTFTGTHAATWRDKLEELRALSREYENNKALMSAYEQQTITGEINARLGQYRPEIESGLIGEWNQSIEQFQAARRAEEKELAREIARWSPAQLRDEMQVTQILIDQAIGAHGGEREAAQDIERLYQEAKASGDAYKMRGTFEVIRGALGKVAGAPLEVRMVVNSLGKQAEQDLRELRTTPGMETANQAAGEAFKAVMAKQREMLEIEEQIGGSQNVYQAASRVTIERETGKINIEPERAQTIKPMTREDIYNRSR